MYSRHFPSGPNELKLNAAFAGMTRAQLYDVMREMNVEFEFQVRRALRDSLQGTSPTAPEPGPVDAQPLDGQAAPVADPAAPGGTPDTMSPPARPLQAPTTPGPSPGTTLSPPPGPLSAPATPAGTTGLRPPTSLVPR